MRGNGVDRNKDIIRKIMSNYEQLEETIVGQLQLDNHHGTTLGSFREEVWQSLFQQIVPRKFSVERSVFIIDSEGNVSNEVDLAIFDEQYTPYIFNYGKMKFIPVEAVAAVVECKSTGLKKLSKWLDSIDSLRTSLKAVARTQASIAMGELDCLLCEDGTFKWKDREDEPKQIPDHKRMTQTSTRPIKILCHTSTTKQQKGGLAERFDIVIHPDKKRLKISVFPSDRMLSEWYETLNHANDKYRDFRRSIEPSAASKLSLSSYKVYDRKDKKTELSLLSLIFQFNQMLMLVNNPIMFPHKAYVEMFNAQTD